MIMDNIFVTIWARGKADSAEMKWNGHKIWSFNHKALILIQAQYWCTVLMYYWSANVVLILMEEIHSM